MEKEEIFKLKQQFLREIPHPKLIIKHLNTLGTKIRGERYVYSPGAEWKPTSEDLIPYLQRVQVEELQLKHRMSLVTTLEQLFAATEELYTLRMSLLHQLADYVSHEISLTKDLKVSVAIDVYSILKGIQNLKENEIKPYLCALENKAELTEEEQVCLLSFLRAKKILTNG